MRGEEQRDEADDGDHQEEVESEPCRQSSAREFFDSGGNVPKRQGHQVVRKIRVLRQQLSSFDRSLRRLASMVGQLNGRIERRRKPRSGSRRPLSAKARISLKLHGKYIGYLRHLKPRQKAQVRKIREAKGVKAAIARAKGLA